MTWNDPQRMYGRTEWIPGYRKGGLGRWEGTDERLGAVLDDAIGTGCVEETGDVNGPGFYARVDRSGANRGGYIVSIDSQGFHSADSYRTTAALDKAWDRTCAYVDTFYVEEEPEEPDPTYRVSFYAFCGMPIPHAEGMTREEARDHCAEYLRRYRRKGRTVTTLNRGRRWEILEPEDCMMIPDDAGTLRLDPDSEPRDW